ncbi:GDP-mannose 4,6-dehydratase [Chloroflexota bacterium]
MRPTEPEALIADASKARERLGWQLKVTFKELVRMMVDADMKAIGLEPPGEGQVILTKHGFSTSDRALVNLTARAEE